MYSSKGDATLRPDQRYKRWIPKDRVKLFFELFKRMSDRPGGQRKTQDILRMSDRVVDEMSHGKLSADNARKIYKASEKFILNQPV